jgi:hypothetical protein
MLLCHTFGAASNPLFRVFGTFSGKFLTPSKVIANGLSPPRRPLEILLAIHLKCRAIEIVTNDVIMTFADQGGWHLWLVPLDADSSNEVRHVYWRLQYAWCAIPLTLLSAYLILWKPRKRE